MRYRKAAKHGIREKYIWKPPDEGKESNKSGKLFKACVTGGCKNNAVNMACMKTHKAAKHGVGERYKGPNHGRGTSGVNSLRCVG